jgi:hypothetical protein
LGSFLIAANKVRGMYWRTIAATVIIYFPPLIHSVPTFQPFKLQVSLPVQVALSSSRTSANQRSFPPVNAARSRSFPEFSLRTAFGGRRRANQRQGHSQTPHVGITPSLASSLSRHLHQVDDTSILQNYYISVQDADLSAPSA